mgnify:FL=1
MKKLARLIGNENKKVLKQTGLRVLLIIIAALTALAPLLDFTLKKIVGSPSYSGHDSNYWTYNAERLKKQLADAEENGRLCDAEYYRVFLDTTEFFEKNNIHEDWRIDVFRSDYATLRGTVGLVKLIIEDGVDSDDINKSMMSSFLYEIDPNGIYPYQTVLLPENIEATYKAQKDALAEFEERILTYTLGDYYASKLEEAKAALETARQSVEYLKSGNAPADPGLPPELSAEFIAYEVALGERLVEWNELNVRAWQWLTDNVFDYRGWQFNTVVKLQQLKTLADSPTGVSRELFYASDYFSSDIVDYEEYIATTQKNARNFEESSAIIRASMEHGVPIRGTVNDSTKTLFLSEFSSSFGIIVIFVIILAGMTLSNEYTAGTVRLLLIRPQRRSRILASKLLSGGILWVAATAVASVLLAVECIALFGVKDLFTPAIFNHGTKVMIVPAIFAFLWRVLLSFISTAPIILFTLLISTLIKRSALPIALAMICRFSTSVITTVSLSLQKLHLEYTPLPYLDLTSFIGNTAERYIIDGGSTLDNIFGAAEKALISSGNYRISIGIAWLVGIAAVLTVLSFVSFDRQQIKN